MNNKLNEDIAYELINLHNCLCTCCRRLNPQHENCYGCDDVENAQKMIKNYIGENWKTISK